MVGYLRSCNISKKAVSTDGELIAVRAGIWRYNSCVDKGITVCPFHRYTYGICCKPPQRCGLPGHSPQSRSKPQRGMTVRMCEIAQLGWGKLCRIGTGKIKNRDFILIIVAHIHLTWSKYAATPIYINTYFPVHGTNNYSRMLEGEGGCAELQYGT